MKRNEIKAESLLSAMMESVAGANLEFKGVFSRNYNDDIISMDRERVFDKRRLNIALSRDSLFHILPEGLFFRENDLRKVAKENNKEKFKALEEQITHEKQTFLTFCNPFDKTWFSLRFALERKLNETANRRTRLWIDTLFDIYGLQEERNPLIRRVLPLIPLASEIRSNKTIWRDILKSIFFPAQVEVRIINKTDAKDIKWHIVKATVYIEKLSSKAFMTEKNEVDAFARFFYEWFLPADMGYEFKVKDANERFVLGKPLTLDYNTQITT